MNLLDAACAVRDAYQSRFGTHGAIDPELKKLAIASLNNQGHRGSNVKPGTDELLVGAMFGLQKQVSSLKASLEVAIDARDRAIEELCEDRNDDRVALIAKIGTIQRRLDHTITANETFQRDLAKEKDWSSMLSTTVAQLKVKMEAQKHTDELASGGYSGELSKLKAQVEWGTKQLAEAEACIDVQKNSIIAKNKELADAAARHSGTAREHNALIGDLANLKNEVAALRSQQKDFSSLREGLAVLRRLR